VAPLPNGSNCSFSIQVLVLHPLDHECRLIRACCVAQLSGLRTAAKRRAVIRSNQRDSGQYLINLYPVPYIESFRRISAILIPGGFQPNSGG
jgi:hypothetical protein